VKCIVCHRQAKGYGWFNTRRKRGDPQRYSDQWVFCSRRCQESFSKLMNKTEGQMIDPSDMEIAAMRACLAPLGEYVGEIGMQRPLADYSRDEVLNADRCRGHGLTRTAWWPSTNAWQPRIARSLRNVWRVRG
jgi:hypothetical protein